MIKDYFVGFLKNILHTWELLSVSIYTEERLERNLRAEMIIGYVTCIITSITTTMNIIQHKGLVTLTTAAIFLGGLIIIISVKKFHNRRVAILSLMFVCVFSFTYYAIFGVNEGFASLWTLIVPLAFCYFASVKYGILMSIYFEILFMILFYTPLRQYESQFYTETFMNRYPVLYLCSLLISAVAMVQYHVSTLRQMDYEKQLEDALERAKSADRAKSMFLAQMSHEIRTPINGVLGMNEMILRETDDEDIYDYAENIQSAGKTLLSLINSILDFSKIEDGKMELVPVEYETTTLINGLEVAISSRAKAKGLAFQMEIDESLPSVLFGDDVRISQIVMNLLTNAVKYTEEGSVTLVVKNQGVENDKARIFFCVKDTGIGIKEEDKDRLFVSFERLDEVKNRHIEGTGLGMSIVTRLLHMMDSKLHVESAYRQGSEFSFELLQKIVDEKPIGNYENQNTHKGIAHETSEFTAPNARVLVVDDNNLNLKVAKGLLKIYGIVPELATSGMETIMKMRTNTYDIVFLDHMMPKMDGIETIKKLKEEDLIPKETAMIALTANAIAGAKETYLSAGFDDYLSKPIDTKELCGKLMKYLPKNEIEKTADDEIMDFSPASESDEMSKNAKDQSVTFDLEKLKSLGLNTEAGLRYSANDMDFYYEILWDYICSYKAKSKALMDCYKNENWSEYKINVHSLKSNTKTIGDEKVSFLALDLENAAREYDVEYIKLHHAIFMKAYQKLVDELKTGMK